MSLDLRLYLVTDPGMGGARPLEYVVAHAVEGGVTVVQLRDKAAGPASIAAGRTRYNRLNPSTA